MLPAGAGMASPAMSGLVARVRSRLRRHGLWSHLLGLLIRPRFTQSGVIAVAGWPLPSVDNAGGRIRLGNVGLFGGVRLECWRGATIEIGSGTYLNRNTEVVAGRSVSIGRDCMIARDVIIMDTDQHALPGAGLVAAPVRIEDRVWIGARAIVLKGVTIGHDSVIGAGAIVTKSVPPHSVVVGPAARVIRTNDAQPSPFEPRNVSH